MEALSIDSLNPSSRAGGASSTDATGMYTTAQKKVADSAKDVQFANIILVLT